MSANPHNASLGLTNSDSTVETTNSPSSSASPPVSLSIIYAPGHEALQALLAFSSLHEQIRERRAREKRGAQSDPAEVWELEQFVLDEVLQLVAERALTLTGADGIAIAMAEENAIVCRASAGTIALEAGVRLDPNSRFSGACLRTGEIVRCDDSENDPRVDLQVCRRLGTRSIVAVPITSAQGTVGLLEAFSAEAYGFNDSDVRSLNLLAELILAAMKPEEENRLAEISQRVVAAESPEAPSPTVRNSEIPATATAAGKNDDPGVVAPAPAIFREYENAQKSRPGLAVVLLLVALAAAMGTAGWWKIRHSIPVNLEPPPLVSLPPRDQPEALPQPAVTEGDSSSRMDVKPALRRLVTGIWHTSSPDSSTVMIDMQGEVQYETHRLTDPERIYIDLHNTALAPGLFGKTIEVGDARLARVRIAQPRRGVSRVVLETTGASHFSVSVQSNPYRLVVEIRKATKSERGAIPDLPKTSLTAAITPQPLSIPTPGQVGNKPGGQLPSHMAKFRLVLDAGHGGWDLGTIGRKGLMEKDLVLDIVGQLGKLVERRLGAEVIYTRQNDSYLPLEKRTEIANLAQADLFVSIHANYSNDSSARGAETYYSNSYSSMKARFEAGSDAAIPENVNWTNVDIRDKVLQSRRFAIAVQQAMYRALAAQIPGMRNRGVKKASYVVLTGTSMPAILAEVSFVSSPADEDKLQDSHYRENIAEALYKGIAQYAKTSHHVNVAGVTPKPTGL